MELLHAFGLDIRIFLAQLVNFAVFVFVLHRFAYKPILDLLEARQKKIERGLEDAKQAAAARENAETAREKTMQAAKGEAKEIVANALAASEKMKEGILREAEERSRDILFSAEKAAEEKLAQIMAEAKKEISALALAAAEKILGEKINPVPR